MEKQYMSIHELSTVLGVSLSTVQRGWKSKTTPPYSLGIKIGKRVLFPIESINPEILRNQDANGGKNG
jgi:hypothetical protein